MAGFINILSKLFGNKYDKDVKKIAPIVEKINKEYEDLNTLTNDELRKKTIDFKTQINDFVADERKQIKTLKENTTSKDISTEQKESLYKEIDILEKIEPDIDGNVKYCTSLEWNKAMEVLKSSQILVLPSRIESVPQSILEAFYLKVPVVATNVGGVHELVSNNKTGLLVTPNNSSELLEKINDLLNDIELCNRLANNAHEFVMKNFSWEVLLPKYIKLYEN